MKRSLRVGVIGYAHSHIDYHVNSFLKLGDQVTWVASADNAPLIQPISEVRGTRIGWRREIEAKVPFGRIYEDWRAMLDNEQFDVMLVCADNAMHGEVCEAILRRGIHVITEKPMADTLQQALRMVRAAREGNAHLVVNWPSTWWPEVRHAYTLIQQGEIGHLFKVTHRNTDSLGPLSYGQQMTDIERGYEWWYHEKAGGGAMLDYCCYGACLSRWFFGAKADAAWGIKARFDGFFGDAEDYATITARYPSGIAIVEGSWTTVNTGIPSGPIFYGTKGTLVIEKDRSLRTYATRHKQDADKIHDVPPLPEGRQDIAQEFLHYLATGELHPTLDLPVNIDAMAMLDAGIRSAVSGKMEQVNDKYWCIG